LATAAADSQERRDRGWHEAAEQGDGSRSGAEGSPPQGGAGAAADGTRNRRSPSPWRSPDEHQLDMKLELGGVYTYGLEAEALGPEDAQGVPEIHRLQPRRIQQQAGRARASAG